MINIYSRPEKKGNRKINYEIKRDYGGAFKDFYGELKRNNNINLDIFFYNLNKLEVIPTNRNSDFINRGAMAEYDILSNRMRIKPKLFKSSIMHELLHLATSIKTKKCIFSGFQQLDRKNGNVIGIGLNEGYVNLIDQRYFGEYTADKKENLRYTYMISTSIAEILERFVGEDLMEKWFFEADLKSLVNYLSQYMPYNDCIMFLVAMDNLFFLVDNGAIKHPIEAANNYKYVTNFLGRCYMNLYIQEYYQGLYSRKELKERLTAVYEFMRKRLVFSRLNIPFSKKISREEFHAYVKYERNKVLQKLV